ncbi:MAG: PAS domain-containing protein [Candidatus Thorarchaeota archaeon]
MRETGIDHSFDSKIQIDGNDHWFTDTLTLHEDGESIVDVARDITEQKNTERTLLETKTLLSAVIEQSPIPMVLASPDGEIVLLNDASRKQLGHQVVEEYQTGMRSDTTEVHQTIYYADGKEIIPKNFFLDKALRGEKTSTKEIKIVRSDGTVTWEEINGVPVFDATGKIIAAYTVFPDKKKRKIAEENLLKSEKLFRVLADSTNEGILVVNRDGSIEYTNASFVKMWNLPREILETMDEKTLLQRVINNFEDPDQIRDTLNEIIGSNKERFDIFRFKDGRIIEAYSRPLFLDEKESKRVWIYREISETPHLEH